MRQGNRTFALALVVAVLALGTGRAIGGPISISFDESQLVNNDPILNFYDGGNTYRGIGPGPNLGVTFTINASVLTDTTNLIGTFTMPGVMLLSNSQAVAGQPISATMNVTGGFGGTVGFDYADLDKAGSFQVFSGFDGQGSLLTSVQLPVTSPAQSTTGIFVSDSFGFSGVGHSIVYTGGNQQIAFDDILLQPAAIPEPPAWSLTAVAVIAAGAGRCAWRRRSTALQPAAVG
jgi:hypothetical protein